MARDCIVCGHPNREKIEDTIINSGWGYKRIATHFGMQGSYNAIYRHYSNHMKEKRLKDRGWEENNPGGATDELPGGIHLVDIGNHQVQAVLEGSEEEHFLTADIKQLLHNKATKDEDPDYAALLERDRKLLSGFEEETPQLQYPDPIRKKHLR